MKRVVYSILSVFILTLAACTDEGMDFNTYGGKGLEFVHFATSGSYLINDDTEPIPVTVAVTRKSNVARTYNVSVVTGEGGSTAVEGIDFQLAQKTVTIPAGEYLGTVNIEPLLETMNQEGRLSIVLALDTDLISPEYGNKTTIIILYEFTVDMDYLIGTWVQSDYGINGELDDGGWDVTISKKADNEINISNFWGYGKTITAIVDFDEKTITIPKGQIIYVDATYGNCFITSFEEAVVDTNKEIKGTLSALGIRINDWCAHVAAGEFGEYSYSLLEKK